MLKSAGSLLDRRSRQLPGSPSTARNACALAPACCALTHPPGERLLRSPRHSFRPSPRVQPRRDAARSTSVPRLAMATSFRFSGDPAISGPKTIRTNADCMDCKTGPYGRRLSPGPGPPRPPCAFPCLPASATPPGEPHKAAAPPRQTRRRHTEPAHTRAQRLIADRHPPGPSAAPGEAAAWIGARKPACLRG